MRCHVDCRPQVRIVYFYLRAINEARGSGSMGSWLSSSFMQNTIFLANVSSTVNSPFGVTQKGILGPVSVSVGPNGFLYNIF